MTALNPVKTIGSQVAETIMVHERVSKFDANRRAADMLQRVGLTVDPFRYPHELSGGMAQRVLLAMALMNSPKLLIADEPTTGLDVTVQAQILDLLRSLVARFDMATLIITHDLGVVAHFCNDIAVMFGGSIVETGSVRDVFAAPAHPYTRNLIAATPERFQMGRAKALGGQPPDLYNLPSGCVLQSRCAYATELCQTTVRNAEVAEGHFALCHYAGRLEEQPAVKINA